MLLELPEAVAIMRGWEANAGENVIVTVVDAKELEPTFTNCC